ncbi:MAG TPA: maleylpyruvate isomerase family mycothiol-dependent enzyme [Actinomycetota bacterium]|nr:maleylpyruvate isomerase family mycothiol-dependent enzyme [Actinomycetota bacterium]
MAAEPDPLSALSDEQDRLEEVLGSLDESAWRHASACPGWTITDVVLHLAQTEEGVTTSITGEGLTALPSVEASSVDELMAGWVQQDRATPPPEVFERWRVARRAALDALRSADPSRALTWVAAPLKPRTLATTRLSEHWIHALDITGPLGVPYPDTDRLWHIARLAHRTLPYAFMQAGAGEAPSVRAVLRSPGGEEWSFGSDDAQCRVEGTAGEFCRVAGRRLAPEEAPTLTAQGERAKDVLSLIRTYA